ncbi:MAG: polysaccharide export protein [Acidobacteriota bacterium]|nr:polysaccharide export protein [Acidobacteriota bacterium]
MAGRRTGYLALAFLMAIAVTAPAFAQATPPQTQTQAPAPATPPPQTPPVLPAPPDDVTYEVGPDDTLSITIFGEPELEKNYKVQADGMIAFPFINNIRVAGLTVRGVESEIRTRLITAKYYENPQVSVDVIGFRSQMVSVRGSVANPGELTLEGREMTLTRALARAGISPLAGSYIEIRRPKRSTPGAPVEYDVQTIQRADLDDLRIDPPLRDGDDIFVPKAPVYYMNGFVKTSGAMTWKPGITIGEAIAAAGGLADRGTFRGLKIQRLVNGEFQEFDADRNTKIQPEDQVIVKQRVF